jgi:hypothetical protein
VGNTYAATRAASNPPVHPRGRGEHDYGFGKCIHVNGSSPRARGTRTDQVRAPLFRRFIPAGAGNTVTYPRIRINFSVHPRGRGEHNLGNILGNILTGSSPRARGTRGERMAAKLSGRFIPAGAGNTYVVALFASNPPIHPRGRGERHVTVQRDGNIVRFIPASVGNATTSPSPRPTCSVHPRRAWGTPRICVRSLLDRFIPAYAGLTHSNSIPWVGSSLRARGTPLDLPVRIEEPRFIPACTGNS